MSDDNNPFSANNIVNRWNKQENDTARRASLFGGSNFQPSSSGGGMSDIRNVIQSFTMGGLMIGMFMGALTATRSQIPIVQGLMIGASGGAIAGAAFGAAVAKTFALGSLASTATRRAMGALDAAAGGYISSAWQGAKWGALAGGGGSLLTGNGGAMVEWITPMVGIGAVAGVGLNAGRKVISRIRGF
ncbi:MAG: hypothetical protein PW788_04265 [Micavibrio sp.]|nr:hypothetical protein [Micavibrio sp.]